MSPTPFVCEIVEELGAWAALEREWQALFEESANPTSTLRWEWLNTWWEVFGSQYGKPPGGLKVILLRRDRKLVAALPLYMQQSGAFSRRRLGFLGTGEKVDEQIYPEKLDILHTHLSESERTQAADEFAAVVANLDWHEWDLGIAPENSLLLQVLNARPLTSTKRIQRTFPDPVADLRGGFEAYLERQSSNSRQQFRRILRSVPKAQLSFEVAQDATQASRYLEELIELHQKRWAGSGQPGAFQSDRVRQYHCKIVERLVPAGKTILARLGSKDQAVAVLYGFVSSDTFDFYQSGLVRDGVGELKSPGIAAHLLLMQHLAGLGINTYDFLAGASSYKDKLATTSRTLVRVRLLKLTLGNVVHMVQEIGSRFSKRFARSASVAEQETKHV